MITISPMSALKSFIAGLKGIEQSYSKNFLQKLGEELSERIRVRVRLGYGCSANGGPRTKFKPLAASTIRFREYLKRKGELVNFSAPKRSHLSATGKMMDDLGYKVDRENVTILFKTRKEIDKAEYNSRTRPFLFLTSSELKAAKNLLEEELDSYVKETFV